MISLLFLKTTYCFSFQNNLLILRTTYCFAKPSCVSIKQSTIPHNNILLMIVYTVDVFSPSADHVPDGLPECSLLNTSGSGGQVGGRVSAMSDRSSRNSRSESDWDSDSWSDEEEVDTNFFVFPLKIKKFSHASLQSSF